jgi:peptidoglycan/LPS O-acetylase OafA/YrhL
METTLILPKPDGVTEGVVERRLREQPADPAVPKSRSKTHLPILDCFRGAAILAVIGIHTLASLSNVVAYIAHNAHYFVFQALFYVLCKILYLGGSGVAVFFIASGFCIHLSHKGSNSGWAVFYTRRVFRLYPTYLASLLFFILVFPLTRWPADWAATAARPIDLLLHLFLIHNLLPQTLVSIDVPYWSLAIEFQLYLLFPLLLVMVRHLGWRRSLIVTAVVEFVSRAAITLASMWAQNIYPSDWWGWADLSPLGFCFSWTLGAAMADAFVEKRPLPFATGPFPLWVWPLLVFVVNNTPGTSNFTFPIAAMASARYLAYFLSRPDSVPGSVPRTNLSMRFLGFIGTISYSLYLLHAPLFSYFMSFAPKAYGSAKIYAIEVVFIIGSLLAVTAFSYLLYILVETPGINWGKKVVSWLRERKAPAHARIPGHLSRNALHAE